MSSEFSVEERLSDVAKRLGVDPIDYPTGTLSNLLRKNYSQEDYSPSELLVIKYFFTNVDRNVFGTLSGRMPDELWALLIGSYSRSAISLRDKFLDTINELGEKEENNPETERFSLEQLASSIRLAQELNLEPLLKKARNFLEKWGVDYGHSSLKDSDILRLSTEGVSQLATKYLEAAVLGAYQEKSTRYLPFTQESLIISPALRSSTYAPKVEKFFREVMERYAQAETSVKEFLAQKVISPGDFNNKRAFQNTLQGKTLDIVRYFLPLAVQTSLGMTMPTREMERHISGLLSQPLEEMQLLGYYLLQEGLQLSPSLLKHVNINSYEIERRGKLSSLAKEFELWKVPDFIAGRGNDAVILSPLVPNGERILLAAILQEHSNLRWYQLLEKVDKLTSDQRENVFSIYIGERGPHETIGKAAELGLLLYDLVLDNGAFRDLARHRRGTILRQRFSPENGFEWPEFIEEPELQAVKDSYQRSVEDSFELWQKVVPGLPHDAQYLAMMGHKVQYLYAADPKQISYVLELRTGPSGHHSYRTLCQEMFRALEKEMPIFSKYLRVNLEVNTNRRKAEEQTAAKKAIGGESK